MNAIPPPEPALYLSIATWVAAVLLLYSGFMLLKRKGIPAFLMYLYRFFISEAA